MVKWRNSKQKKQLYKDIVNGVVDESTDVNAVYNMHDGIYLEFELTNFRTNLKNLIKSITKSRNEAVRDFNVLANTLERKNAAAAVVPAYPAWQSSDARALLVNDLAAGFLDGMKPSEIQQTRTQYMSFPPKIFRDNYYKELHKPKVKAYWEFQKELKQQKKQKKQKKNNNDSNKTEK
jgi:hypothetical protein